MFTAVSRWSTRRLLAAALVSGAMMPAAFAQGVLKIGMTASDIPLSTGQADNGGEGMRSRTQG